MLITLATMVAGEFWRCWRERHHSLWRALAKVMHAVQLDFGWKKKFYTISRYHLLFVSSDGNQIKGGVFLLPTAMCHQLWHCPSSNTTLRSSWFPLLLRNLSEPIIYGMHFYHDSHPLHRRIRHRRGISMIQDWDRSVRVLIPMMRKN